MNRLKGGFSEVVKPFPNCLSPNDVQVFQKLYQNSTAAESGTTRGTYRAGSAMLEVRPVLLRPTLHLRHAGQRFRPAIPFNSERSTMKNLFVGNLDFSTTENEVRSLFEGY